MIAMISHRAVVRATANLRRLSAVYAIQASSSSLRTIHARRHFSFTPSKQAATTPPHLDPFSSAALNSPLFKELSSKPEVLKSMTDLMSVMQQEGIVVDPANPPSTMRLFMNSKIRSQLMETWRVLQEAGVDQAKLKEALELFRPKSS